MAEFKEELVSSEEVFNGRIMHITVDTVRVADGQLSRREVLHHNGGAAIVALNEKGEVALVHQYRHAVGAELIELPAGKIEPGEPAMETAVRELQEEAGLTADNWQALGSILPSCGYSSEVIYLYLATGLHAAQQSLDAHEFLTVFWMPLREAVEKVVDGTIRDSKTVTALLRVQYMRDREMG